MTTRFHGLTFLTDPGRVFSPRSATEKLVDAALDRIGDGPARIADVGTGSGAIAITLALRAPTVEVWASDTCGNALALASLNAERLGAQVHLVHGDLLEGIPHDLDLIVANLPYLSPGHAGLRRRAGEGRLLDPATGSTTTAGCSPPPPTTSRTSGGIMIQFDGEVLEAERSELPWLRSRLESMVATAA